MPTHKRKSMRGGNGFLAADNDAFKWTMYTMGFLLLCFIIIIIYAKLTGVKPAHL